ncbi:MAG: PIN domain-containing protein [Clostridia bacterium]
MKYLLLDTNILIDCISSRNDLSSNIAKNILEDLLEKNKCKLILPEIVKYEFERNIDSLIKGTGVLIKESVDALKKLHWVDFLDDKLEDFEEEIQAMYESLLEKKAKFNDKKDILKQEIENWFCEKVSNNQNTILIETYRKLIVEAERRKYLKIPPFHNQDNQFGDSLILVTLYNIKDYISLNDDDVIFFISNNYNDFCDEDDGEKLHPYIQKELKTYGLSDKVIFSRHILKTLNEHFNVEVDKEEINEDKITFRDIIIGLGRVSESMRTIATNPKFQEFATTLLEMQENSKLNKFQSELYGGLNNLNPKAEDVIKENDKCNTA